MVNHPKFLSEKLSTFNEKISTIMAIWFKKFLGNLITTKSHHKEDSMVGCKITSMFTDFIGHLLRFPTPTYSHIFGNHGNGYGHSKRANMRSSVDHWKLES
jgi:hypothetical protein